MTSSETPSDTSTNGLSRVVVRGFGYNKTHLALVPDTAIEPMSWPSPAYPFSGVRSPVKARCGVTVRSVQPCVVVMDMSSPDCRICEALDA